MDSGFCPVATKQTGEITKVLPGNEWVSSDKLIFGIVVPEQELKRIYRPSFLYVLNKFRYETDGVDHQEPLDQTEACLYSF